MEKSCVELDFVLLILLMLLTLQTAVRAEGSDVYEGLEVFPLLRVLACFYNLATRILLQKIMVKLYYFKEHLFIMFGNYVHVYSVLDQIHPQLSPSNSYPMPPNTVPSELPILFSLFITSKSKLMLHIRTWVWGNALGQGKPSTINTTSNKNLSLSL